MIIDNEEYKHARACCKFVEDAAAFLRSQTREGEKWSREQAYLVLETLIHDITGLANRETCFLPRVSR